MADGGGVCARRRIDSPPRDGAAVCGIAAQPPAGASRVRHRGAGARERRATDVHDLAIAPTRAHGPVMPLLGAFRARFKGLVRRSKFGE
jgi:hypothetical protein